ncbi:hypothetical protein PHYSODRAFT_532432, partial [Phytophthora sojae]
VLAVAEPLHNAPYTPTDSNTEERSDSIFTTLSDDGLMAGTGTGTRRRLEPLPTASAKELASDSIYTPLSHNGPMAGMATWRLEPLPTGRHMRALEDGDGDGKDSSDSGSDHDDNSNVSSNGHKSSSSFFDHSAVVIVVGVVAVVLAITGVMMVVVRRRRSRAMERNITATSLQASELSPAPPVGVVYARQ